ncbi:glycosyltransferase [Candidatus Roizmanbacteria bacterium]|nr:glycosyltransferase [Candidatus Roizmanbacteria bacterium]
MAANILEMQAFNQKFPEYALVKVNDWWSDITGKEPRECPGITIGIPVFNEAKGIRRVILEEILEQRLPGEVPITIICATDGSTDGSPEKVQSIINEFAEKRAKKEGGKKRKEDFIKREQFVWPQEELVGQYRKQHWPEEDFGKTIEKTTVQAEDGVRLVHIFNSQNQGKNNAMNMIRAHTDTPEIIYVDGDVRLHPYAIGELYGTLVKQNSQIVAGNYIPYWDQKTLWANFMRHSGIKLNLNDTLPKVPFLLGSLFIMETSSKSIPYFPVDIMYEDKWLRLFCAKYIENFKQSEAALVFQRRPSTLIEQIQEVLRVRFHDSQLYALHKDDLPVDFIPRAIEKSIVERLQEADGKLVLLAEILIILLTKKMVADFEKSGRPWHELKSFKRIASTKL